MRLDFERHLALLARLQSQLIDTVANALGPGQECLLLDVPEHANVGDHAILLGERQLVAGTVGRISYMSSIRTNSWDAIERRPEAAILLQGGGNFGDLWPQSQRFREMTLRRFPSRKILVMPQSVHFETPANLRRAQRSFGGHHKVTVLARDNRSFEYLQRHFDVEVVLCPDAALILAIKPPTRPRHHTIALLRTDKERRGYPDQRLEGIPAQDWLDRRPPERWKWPGLMHRIRAHVRPYRDRPFADPILSASFSPVARYHLNRGVNILSAGGVVITDRLHGHILCFLMGIPHVVLDNSYGKVFAFIETWTKASPLVRTAACPREARMIAADLDDERFAE